MPNASEQWRANERAIAKVAIFCLVSKSTTTFFCCSLRVRAQVTWTNKKTRTHRAIDENSRQAKGKFYVDVNFCFSPSDEGKLVTVFVAAEF